MRFRLNRLYHRLTVPTKVWLLVMMTVTLALSISTAGLILQQVKTDRENSARRHEQLARIISANTGAALVFGDREAATENLATVAEIEDVAWVHVFADGPKAFASFANPFIPGAIEELRFPVLVDGRRVGELRMGVHHLTLGEILGRAALPALASFAGSLFLALALSRWFFAAVFRPITQLLAMMRGIVASGDYAQRLELDRGPDYELIGSSFNAMLDELEARDAALHETTAQLRTARDAAEQASVAKSQFLANMSHELRTPLNAIIGYTEVLHDELSAAALDRSVEDVRWIHGSARQLLELINDILDLSKIEAGRMMIDPHETDLARIMRDVRATLEPLAAQKRNTLHVQLDPSLRLAFTDATKLRQCLLNLGANACKFTEHGHVFIHGRQDGDELVFSVSDTGIGLSPEQLDRLFQPFVQADASTTRRYGGTGLGLTITWRFAEMLGGTVNVDSVPGQGSTFTLRIRAWLDGADAPAAPAEAEAPSPALPVSEPAHAVPGKRARPLALIVEDEPSSAQLLTRLVEQAGYEAVVAVDGGDGLRIARARRPDLVLLDIGLPLIDGWEVLRAFEEDRFLKAIPTIVVTVDDDRARVFEAGASEHLVKPVDRSELNDILAQYAARGAGSVLIVEDDPATARLWERGVTQMGYAARIVHDGQDALDALAEDTFDIVVTDLRMPVIDGFALVAAISRMPPGERPGVIVATGKVLDEAEERFFRDNCARLVSKSGLSPRKLAECLVGDPPLRFTQA